MAVLYRLVCESMLLANEMDVPHSCVSDLDLEFSFDLDDDLFSSVTTQLSIVRMNGK